MSARPDPTGDNLIDGHPVAVARTLTWADEAADRGDHGDALAWLAVIEAVDGMLPSSYETKRAAWLHALARKRPED